jgi:hypothetical protein
LARAAGLLRVRQPTGGYGRQRDRAPVIEVVRDLPTGSRRCTRKRKAEIDSGQAMTAGKTRMVYKPLRKINALALGPVRRQLPVP